MTVVLPTGGAAGVIGCGCAAARSATLGWYGVQLSSRVEVALVEMPGAGTGAGAAARGAAAATAAGGDGAFAAGEAGGSMLMIRIGVIGTIGGSGAGSGAAAGGGAAATGSTFGGGEVCGRVTSSSGIFSVIFWRVRFVTSPTRVEGGGGASDVTTVGGGGEIAVVSSSITTSMALSEAVRLPAALAAPGGSEFDGR